MEIKDNFNLLRLFASKDVSLLLPKNEKIVIHLKTIRDFYTNDTWNAIYNIWKLDVDQIQKSFGIKAENNYDFICKIIFDFGMYNEYNNIANNFRDQLKELIQDINIDMQSKQIKVGSIIINSEIWDYILYILHLSYGEKVNKPIIFTSDKAKELYTAQKKNEERIQSIRSKNGKQDEDWLLKQFLYIIYAFPSLTIEYLLDQTMAQIQWLLKFAAGSVSYDVTSKAYAAGNLKKGSKLEFFIK